MALMITVLYRYREKYTKFVFLLIPLQLLRSNSHIYFPIGILVTLLFIIDIGVTHRKNLLARQPKVLFLTLTGMGLVTLMNPHGLSGALYPLTVMQNYGYTIEENQTPFLLQSLGFAKPTFFYISLGMITLFSALILTIKKARLVDWLLAIIFSAVALSAVRNFPLFVFATLIPCAHALSSLLSHLPSPHKKYQGLITYSMPLLLLILFIWQANSVTAIHPIGYGVYEDGKQALNFIKRERIDGPIFNNFDIGSYIESRLYPKEKVFIDGRPEAYPAAFIKNTYIPMQQDPALFLKVSNAYHFNAIIFSHTDQTPWAEQFIGTIIQSPDWKTVYLDPTLIVLVKNSQQNAVLIKKFGLPQTLPMTLPNDERLLRQAAHFYSTASLPKQLLPILKRLTDIKPHDCQILGALTAQYLAQNDPATQIYQLRYQRSCIQ
jgi:hypothetical protein